MRLSSLRISGLVSGLRVTAMLHRPTNQGKYTVLRKRRGVVFFLEVLIVLTFAMYVMRLPGPNDFRVRGLELGFGFELVLSTVCCGFDFL